MAHTPAPPATPPTGIDPAAAPAPSPAARPRQCTADYRWTQPKVVAFLEALAQCGRVAEAARVVGMSRTSAYRLRARMASTRFEAAFEGARRSGIRARAAASQARMAIPPSRWDGPGIAELAARERAATQGNGGPTQICTLPPQGDASAAQGGTRRRQGDAFPHKVTP